MPRNVVCLINRSSKVLQYRFDGIDEILQPGENPGIPAAHADFAKAQNKVMGTEEFYNPTKFVSLIGVKGSKDDCSPMEQTDEVEVINRKEKNQQFGQVSETRKAAGPTVFDSRMPGAEDSTAGFSAGQGDSRPKAARQPVARGGGRRR